MTKIISLSVTVMLLLFACKDLVGKTVSPLITQEQNENYYEAFYALQENIVNENFQFEDKGYPFRKATNEEMKAFYDVVGNVPVWVNEDGMNIHSWTFLEELKSAGDHGLIP